MSPSPRTIPAAGGVVWRLRDGAVEVLLIHRPRYDDWSLPKGKLLSGEPELVGAVREIGEEVGAVVDVKHRIRTVKYHVGDARKRVAYWSMRYRSGNFAPNGEVDDTAWLHIKPAYKKLTYDIDRSVLDAFTAAPVPDSVVILLRHAKAGKRTDWRADDRLRPLDPFGEQQARALAEILPMFGPTSVYTADRTRCVQTVEPLAAALDVRVRIEPAFSDEAYLRDPEGTASALLTLAKPGKVSVVCSQGVAIPELVDRLGPGVRSSETRKAAWWVFCVVDGEIATSDYYDPPQPGRQTAAVP